MGGNPKGETSKTSIMARKLIEGILDCQSTTIYGAIGNVMKSLTNWKNGGVGWNPLTREYAY